MNEVNKFVDDLGLANAPADVITPEDYHNWMKGYLNSTAYRTLTTRWKNRMKSKAARQARRVTRRNKK